jgi:ABC-type phosphate transport system substrate-binding protein
MHRLRIAVAGAAAAALIGIGAGPALADPPAGVTPTLTSIVGVGAQSTQFLLDGISTAYNATKPATDMYSFDAVSASGLPGGVIKTKGLSGTDLTCVISRPANSAQGITALATSKSDDGHPCVDFARSSASPSSTTPAHLAFAAMAKDAVTWTVPSKAAGVPASLTQAQLDAIYSCKDRTWASVGGKGAGSSSDIVPALPMAISDTRGFFLAAIGNPVLGSCVVNGAYTVNGASLPLQENTAVSAKDSSGDYYTGNAYFFAHNPNAIYPYSAAEWISQQAAPAGGGHAGPAFGNGGIEEPKEISGISPITAGQPDTISTAFTTGPKTLIFTRLVYNVVPNLGTASAPKIAAGPITAIFGPKGYICGSDGTTLLKSYGFLPLGGLCGFLTGT